MIKSTIQIMIAWAVLISSPFFAMYLILAILIDIVRCSFEFTPWLLSEIREHVKLIYQLISE